MIFAVINMTCLLVSVCNSKCYKLFEDALSYSEADAVCRSVGFGSLGTLLIQLEDYAELETMKKLCRGDEYVMYMPSCLYFILPMFECVSISGHRILPILCSF